MADGEAVGGGSPLHGAPKLPPCAGTYPSWKELGMSTISLACPGPLGYQGGSLADGEAVLGLGKAVCLKGRQFQGSGRQFD